MAKTKKHEPFVKHVTVTVTVEVRGNKHDYGTDADVDDEVKDAANYLCDFINMKVDNSFYGGITFTNPKTVVNQ